MSRKLLGEYLVLHGEYRTQPFTLEKTSQLLATPSSKLRNELYKMRKNLALQHPKRGVYRTIDPDKWIGLAMGVQRFPELMPVFQTIQPRLHHIKSIMIYGSRVRGDYREDSDYDLLLVTDGSPMLSEEEINALKKQGFELDFGSELDLRKEIQDTPVSIVPILKEAWPLFNRYVRNSLLKGYRERHLLKDLKRLSRTIITNKYTAQGSMKADTKRSFLFLSLDASRQLCLMETLLGQKPFTTQRWLDKTSRAWGMKPDEVRRLYRIYKEVEREKKPRMDYLTSEKARSIVEGNIQYLDAIMKIWEEE